MRALCLALASFVALLCGCSNYSRSVSGVSALDKKVLWDFRTPHLRTAIRPAPAETERVLSAVFPSSLRDFAECVASKAQGRRIASITQTADGAFTAPGAKERLYVVVGRPCSGTRGEIRLAVFSADRNVADVLSPVGGLLLDTVDLNGDGKNEILFAASHRGEQSGFETAALVQFDKNKLVTIEDFGQVYEDSCRSLAEPKSLMAVVLNYLPTPGGQMPKFTADIYRAPCPAPDQKPNWVRAEGK
ncbi:MAG: hypothetical protein ACR2IF_11390 [Terriglobales bacterium]